MSVSGVSGHKNVKSERVSGRVERLGNDSTMS